MADPTIDQVFEEFLEEQYARWKPSTVSKYEDVISLLRHHLNGYGYDSLSKEEGELFDKYYNAEGEEHREFCQLFGPDKIVGELGMFLNYFLIRKVIAGPGLMKSAGTVIKKLSKWLLARGYISTEDGEIGLEEGTDAARDLPKADKAARILAEDACGFALGIGGLEKGDYLDFAHFRIARVEPGKLWFYNYPAQKPELLGPVIVPRAATQLLREYWDISCALGRVRGTWRMVEVANVYPG